MRRAHRMRPSGPVIAWALTRSVLAVVALSAWFGEGTGIIRPVSDVELYAGYARQIMDGAVPYADVAIEYPVGALPLVIAPEVLAALPGLGYVAGFVLVALLLDLAGLVALRRLAAHTGGSSVGVWTWVIGGALLGPVVLLRLDLLPVVAVLWAAERAAAGRWAATGGLLALGGAAKLWPAGLLPAAAVSTPRWRRVLVGAAVVAGTLAAATIGVLGEMLDASVLRNLGRGLQIETLWGSLLLGADVLGLADTSVSFADGANQVTGGAATVLVWLARATPVVVVGIGAWLASPRRPNAPDDPTVRYVTAAEAATLVLLAGAAVLSVQFVLWGLGAVAAAACLPERSWRPVLVAAACLLTTIEFPWLYEGLTAPQPEPLVVGVVLGRNLLLVAAAVSAVRAAWAGGTAHRMPART